MSTTDRMDRLERITNTLLENIAYFDWYPLVSHQQAEEIEVELCTAYGDIMYMQCFGVGPGVEAAKRNACRKIAEKIITNE